MSPKGLPAPLLVAVSLLLTGAQPPAAPLPGRLASALGSRDPVAFADTTLPRLAALTPGQRAAMAESLDSWPVPRRVAAWAFLQVGTPYQLGPLGEEAPPDPQPLITFETTDCAVLNLVSTALAHAREAGGEREAMAIANYHRGIVSYRTRFHFTTDRLDSCPYFRDITRSVGKSKCRTRRVALNRGVGGKQLIPIEWTRARVVAYVPRASSGDFARWYAEGRLPEVTGVAFVQEKMFSQGLDVVHESLLWRGQTLLHASSRTGRVVTLPWEDYLAGPGLRHDGFVLFEYR